ncbi:TPA: ZmpA/ZmpB/ZmpC family metallo-endopeptidase [Streptococcus suis]
MHKFFYEQRKAFSIRKLTVGVVSLCIGSSLLVGQNALAADTLVTSSTKDIHFEYVLETELTKDERQLIQSSLPAELTETATYFVVYRPAKTGLPKTGDGVVSGLMAATAGFIVLAVLATKNKKARILSMLYITATGLALPLLEVSAVESQALASYNQTITIRPGDSLPDGKLRLDGYEFVGYLVEEKPEVQSQAKDEKTSLSNSSQIEEPKTGQETAEADQQVSTGEIGEKIEEVVQPELIQTGQDQASQPVVEKIDETVESQKPVDPPTESPVEVDKLRPVVEETKPSEEPVQPPVVAVEEKLVSSIPAQAPRHLLPTIDFQVQDKVEETALEIPEEQIETNQLPLGQSRVEEGQAGSLRISYQEVLVDGQVVARNEIGREEIPSIPRKVYIGTGQVVEEEVVENEPSEEPVQPPVVAVEEKLVSSIPAQAPSHLLQTIDFQVQDKVEETALEIPEEQIETNQLPLGQSRVEEGQAGSRRISYQEVLVDGQVVARKEISREEVPSIPRKVYIGTGQVAEEEVVENKPSEEPVQPTPVEEKLVTSIPTEAPSHHLPTLAFQVEDKVEETTLAIPEEVIETDELAIGQSRVEEGQAGSLRISYQEVLVDGQIVARKEISREEVPSTPKRTYIGTRRDEKYVAPEKLELPRAIIRTQEEEIAFERKEILRADWPLGKVEVVAGKKGKQLHTYAVIEGVETLLKTEVLEQAEAEITYKGVKGPEMTTEEIVIDFTERVISDPEQYTDYRQIEVAGEQGLKRLHKENGQLVNEEIVKPAKEQVVRVGTKPIEGQVEKESLRTIDFTRRYESNDQLDYGQTRTKQTGQSGQEKVISTYQTIKGVEGQFISSRIVSVRPVQDEIVEVGTKPQVRIEQEEPVTEYVPAPDKERDVQTLLQEGHGKETTYRTIYNLDTASGRVTPIHLPGKVTHLGQVRRISVGTKPTVTKKTLPFSEEVVSNSTLYVGERVIVRPGRTGEKITTVHYTLNPRTGETSAGLPQIQEILPVAQFVQVGTKAVDRTVETVDNRDIAFQTEFQADSTLPYPQREVLQEGSNGVERITTTRRYVRDQEVGEPTQEIKVVRAAQNRIIKVGTKPVVRRVETDFTRVYEADPNRSLNEQFTKQSGIKQETTYTKNYVLNTETGEVREQAETRQVTRFARQEIVQVGTRPTTETTSRILPTRYEADINRAHGQQHARQQGRPEITTFTTTYSVDPRTGATQGVRDTGRVTDSGQEQIVQVGTKPVVRRVETDFTRVYEADPNRSLNEQFTKQSGIKQETTYTTNYVLNIETGVVTEQAETRQVTRTGRQEIVQVGTRPTTETTSRVLPTRYEADNNRVHGQQHTRQQGRPEITTFTTTYSIDPRTGTTQGVRDTGRVTDRGQEQIIQVGTRPTTETTSRVLPTRYEADNSRAHGQQQTRQQGRPEITTFTTTYSVDPRTGATQAVRDTGRVTDRGQEQIIQVGTKPVERTEREELSPITRQNAELAKGTGNVIHEGSPTIRVYRTNYSVDHTTGQITTHPEVLVSETVGRAREVEIGTKEPEQPVTPPTENEESCPIIPDNTDGGTCEAPTELTEKPSSPDLECILNPTDQCWPEEPEEVNQETVAQLRAKMEQLMSYRSRFRNPSWHTYIDAVYNESDKIIQSGVAADIRTQLDVIDDDLEFVIDAQIPKISTDANSGASRAENIELITDANGGTAPRYEDNPTPVTPNPDQGSGTEKPVETPIPPVPPVDQEQPVPPVNPPVTPIPEPEQPRPGIPDTPDTTETETPIDVDIDSLPKPTMFIRKVDIQKDARKAIIHYILEDSAERFEGGQAHLFVNDKIVSTVPIRRQNGRVQAEFTDLKPNVDYLVRTDLTYSGTSESLVDSLADEASIEIEERQLQIKNIDRVELWKFENGKASIQRELATKPTNLTTYFAKVISNQQKEILLPISQVELVTENGEQFYSVTASLDNLVEEQSTSHSYRPGLTFRVAKQKISTSTGTYTDFASLVQAMQERPWDTFTLGADLTASSVNVAGRDSYISNQFSGRLNGAGYTIYDLEAPLFKKTIGQIENLNLKDVAIHQKDKREVGALAKESGGGRIEQISVEGTVIGGNQVGGLLGSVLHTQVSNITVKGKISSQSTDLSDNYLGGVAGWIGTGGQLQSVSTDVQLSTNSSRARVGGIVGQMEYANSFVKKAYAKGSISAPKNLNSEIGGIVGIIAGASNSIIDDVVSAVSVPNGRKVYHSVTDTSNQVGKIYTVEEEATGQDNEGQVRLQVSQVENLLREFGIQKVSVQLPNEQDSSAKFDIDYSLHPHYQESRKLAYENMEKLLPFFTKDVIIQQANRLSMKDSLVTKKLLDAVPIDAQQNRPIFDVYGSKAFINKLMLHFEDGTITYDWLVKKQELNNGDLTEYYVVDRDITYTPENLVQKSRLDSLVERLVPEFSGVDYRSKEVLDALGLTGSESDYAIKELLFLNESFAKVKSTIRQQLKDLLVSNRAISLTSQTIEDYMFDYISKHKAQLLLGLAYMDRWYSIRYGDINAQEWMVKKPDFFGNQVNSLDQLINLGSLGAGGLKPNNNFAIGSQFIAKPAVGGNLFDYLEAYRKRFLPNSTDSDWFKSATKANIIETNSTVAEVRAKQEDVNNKQYSNRFYDKLKSSTWSFKEMALILLTMPSRDIFILTDMANTVIGSYDNQSGTKEEIEARIEKTAKDWASHADYLYRILPEGHKEKMIRQIITWDTKKVKGSWYDIESLSSRSKDSFKYFYMPLGYTYPIGYGANAQSDLRNIFYFNADVTSREGSRVYTHELTHVAEDDTFLLGHGRRSSMDLEAYARGLFETINWFDQDILGVNNIFDFSEYEKSSYGRRLTNLNPERFQSTKDLETYMKGYMDVLYTLDYLEAEAVLNLGGDRSLDTARRKWFNKMDTRDENATWIEQFGRANQYNTIDDLIDQGMVSRRSYDPEGHGYNSYFERNSYHTINALNPLYGSLNNNGESRNEFEFRKIAFELLAEKGYENGFVPYLSNQYQSELGQADSAGRIRDDQLIAKITGGAYSNAAQFRKEMFKRRRDMLEQLKPVTVIGQGIQNGDGYFYGSTKRIQNISEMRELMRVAVEYDAYRSLYSSQTSGYSHRQSHVYSLKAAILNGYLRETKDFRESIYVTNP